MLCSIHTQVESDLQHNRTLILAHIPPYLFPQSEAKTNKAAMKTITEEPVNGQRWHLEIPQLVSMVCIATHLVSAYGISDDILSGSQK